MPEVDLITIVKMVSKLVPSLELMSVVMVVEEVLKLKQWESIERSSWRNLSLSMKKDSSFLLIEASLLKVYA